MQIDRATAEHGGTYLCSISNKLDEIWTKPVDVDIGKSDENTVTDSVSPFSPILALYFYQTLLPPMTGSSWKNKLSSHSL